MNALLLHTLKDLQDKGRLKYYENHPLSLVSTFGIGGKAGVFILPKSKDTLCYLISLFCKKTQYKIIGNASNLLFSDDGFNGAVICTKQINDLHLLTSPRNLSDRTIFNFTNGKKLIFADCGCFLPHLCSFAHQNGISGFEGLCSIPATIGGAIMNNAGAFGCEISDNLVACELYYPQSGKKLLRTVKNTDFSYRESHLKYENAIILSAYFSVKDAPPSQILSNMLANKTQRSENQPIGVKSAGSYFKRPHPSVGFVQYRGKSAGELIDICGLKGFSVGKATVSEKHANFIVNPQGDAKSSDVLVLARMIKDTVYKKTGIRLCEEVEYVPSNLR